MIRQLDEMYKNKYSLRCNKVFFFLINNNHIIIFFKIFYPSTIFLFFKKIKQFLFMVEGSRSHIAIMLLVVSCVNL